MPNWRRDFPVLVVDAQALGSLAAIRSLGRAGYPVIAASSDPTSVGLRSRYAATPLVSPSYKSPHFMAWLREKLTQERVRAIVPSEGLLHAVRSAFEEFSPLLPLSKNATAVYSNLSKFDLFAAFQDTPLRAHLPNVAFLGEGFPPLDTGHLDALGYPLFVKFDSTYARSAAGNVVLRIGDNAEFQARMPRMLDTYSRGLVQGYCPGIGVGAFVLNWQGREIAHFMHRRLHEVPHTGGVSSFRRAWHHADILADTRARARHLVLEGVAMFEYRWDPTTDDYRLIELNSRFWGSLHLALFAGVDFPRLLLDAFFGHPEECGTYDPRVACRLTFPREVEYVISCMRDPSLSLNRRLWPALEFLLLGMDPRIRSDLLYPGDRMLYLRMMRWSIAKFLSKAERPDP